MESMVRRISKIQHVEYIENKILLQGVEEGVENVDDGLAWNLQCERPDNETCILMEHKCIMFNRL